VLTVFIKCFERSTLLFILLLLLVPGPALSVEDLSHYDFLWANRDKNANTETALSQLKRVTEQRPTDAVAHWNLARFYYWAASEEKTSSSAASLAKKGWDAAEVAKRLEPWSIEGWYWATANIGMYAEAAGTFVTVSEDLSTHYKNNAEKAIELSPLYDAGGPYRSLGIYYTKLPWPLQDLEKAKELIGRSLEEDSERALSLYYYADIQFKMGDTEGAQKTLNSIIELDPEKGNAPEIRRYQPLAKQRLRSIQ